jgi:SAM-dependent methyltransferase
MVTNHPVTPAEAWEFRYQEQSQRWSGRPNATLVDLVGGIPANGRALDLGSGEGADAIWLARQGWHVTGVDISPTAVARAHGAAIEAGIPTDQIRFEAHDLSAWEPDGPYDLVTASFFHSQEELARTEILRRVATHIASGGHLAIVSHAPPAPGTGHHDHLEQLMDADGEIAALGLGDDWDVVTSEHRSRDVTTPAGGPAVHDDVAVLLRRR